MPDPRQRQFKPSTLPPFKAPFWIVRAWEEKTPSYPAFLALDDGLKPTAISEKDGQDFCSAATAFEKNRSQLCRRGDFVPVVDEDYNVKYHIGEAWDGKHDIYVLKGLAAGGLEDIVNSGKPVFVGANPDPAKFEEHDQHELRVFKVLCDQDGQVLSILRSRSADGLAPPDIDPVAFIALAKIGLTLVGKGMAKYLVRRAANQLSPTFRVAMAKVEKKLLDRGARAEAAKVTTLTEDELSKVWGAGTTRPLTGNQVDRAIELLRNGHDVHVESLGQMRQIQAELGQLGVRSESSSAIIPQRPLVNEAGQTELEKSYVDGRGTFRVDDAHAPGSVPYNLHDEFPHINITLRNGKTLAIIVTGKKSF